MCNGQAVSRSEYSELFQVIGTTYGSGDGSSTFNLPNLGGRVPVGKASSGTFATVGSTGGAETHTLTTAQMPSHTHSISSSGSHTHTTDSNGSHYHGVSNTGTSDGSLIYNGGYVAACNAISGVGWNLITGPTGAHTHSIASSGGHTHSPANTGGGGSHNNLQPYITLNYIIRAK